MSLPAANTLNDWAARALQAAAKAGASQAEVGVSTSRALTVGVRMGAVESVEFQRDRDLSLTVYFGQSMGSASTADLSDAGLALTVAAACDIARAAGSDPCLGLADANRLYQAPASGSPDLGMYHPWALTPELATEYALATEAAAFAASPHIKHSEGASVDSRESLSVYANSHGFVSTRRGSEHAISCAVIAADGEEMQNGHEYTTARRHAALQSPDWVGAQAGQHAAARLGSKTISTRTAPVMFNPQMARGLIGQFLGGISGGALYRKSTFLLDRLGTPVFAPHISLHQRPFIVEGAGSALHDGEGVAAVERSIVERGVLSSYLLGSYAARKLGMQSTGNANGAYNVVLEAESADFASLLQRMGTGLLVTGLMGQGLNMMTGDYSRGAEGFWVENGQIIHPVDEVTIAGNLGQMLAGIVAMGTDIDTRGGVRTGSLLLPPMTIAGA